MPRHYAKIILLLVISIAIILSITSCGGIQRQLVGVWQGGGETFEFRDDGTVIFKSALTSSEGYWKEADSTHIDMQLSGIIGNALSGRWEVRISDDILTMIHQTGAVIRYSKFK